MSSDTINRRANTMKKSTIEIIISAFNCASKDVTRPNLNGVLITPSQVVACDGHILSSVDHGEDKDAFKENYYVEAEQLPLIKLILKSMKYIPELTPVYSADKGLEISDGTVKVFIKTEKFAERKYPNYKQLIPEYKIDAPSISLNAELLLKVAKALKGDSRLPVVKLTFKDNLSPIIVKIGDRQGLIMPCRV